MSRPRRNAAVEANNIIFGLNDLSSSDDSADENLTDDEEDIVTVDDESDAIISDQSDEERVQENYILNQNMISKNGEEIWSTLPSENAAQPRAHNIIRQPTGPTRFAAQVCGQSVDTAFKLFITPEMIRIIVNCTNAEAHRIRLEGWVDTTVNELYEFIGVLLLAGVFHCKNQSIKELWSKLDGISIFSTSMQRDRFVNLRRCIRFDERETRNQRRFEDKFAPLRNIMEMFTTKCKSNYNPSAYLTVDEQLVTFRGRCPFKMFIPTKPGKYGMKIWILCDAETSYCINLQPYIGRVNGVRDVGQGTRVVLELTDHLNGSGRHITADNFFTNIHLARALLGRKMTYTGTIKKNKGEIPKKLLPALHRPVYSSIFGFQNDSTIVSYVPKKNKAVILLSTFHHSNDIVMDHNEKPCIILDYNKYKGGVDTLDQVVRCYSSRRKSNRWPFTMFCNILDIAAYNALILFLSIHPNYKNGASHRRREFLKELSKSLIKKFDANDNLPQIVANNNLRQVVVQNNLLNQGQPNQEQHIKRCYMCPRVQDRKTRLQCASCRVSAVTPANANVFLNDSDRFQCPYAVMY
ncbi:piggyBac transposable element-derived protein 4-like isoform X1 [Hydra vulgaris]|uniref:piggyBac transposable element-derived protein 4-like isoform X1 n=1 Tax=Hydra vulgaris TaxID=6087 RepID=UPI0032E9BF50